MGNKLFIVMCACGNYLGKALEYPKRGEVVVLEQAFGIDVMRRSLTTLPVDVLRLDLPEQQAVGVFLIPDGHELAKGHKAAVQQESLKRSGLVGPGGGGLN